MIKKVWCAAVAVAALVAVADAAPLEAYARLPYHEDVSISPDGTHLAFITTVGDQREAIIQSLADSSTGTRIKVGAKKLRGVGWANPNYLIIDTSKSTDFLAGEQDELYQLSIYDLKRNEFIGSRGLKRTHSVALISMPGESVPVSNATIFLKGLAYGSYGIFQIDLDRRTETLLDAGGDWKHKGYAWVVNKGGQLVAMATYEEEEKKWSLSLLRDGKWIDVVSQHAELDEPIVLGLGPENDTLIINRIEDHELVPRRLSLIDGKWGEALPAEWRGSRYLHDRTTFKIIGSVRMEARRHYVFFDKNLQDKWDQVVWLFPGEEVVLQSWTDDWQKIIVHVFGPKTGSGFILIDTTKNESSYLGNLYSEMEPKDIAAVRPIRYDAADGLQIDAYLTLPTGKALKNLPLIVMPHGGPNARDMLGFDWLAQALAAQGYLVLQPNYRGSWSMDTKFKEAGYGEYGRKMQTDLSDGAKALAKLGVVDSKRVCILGLGYGGYAALAGATMEPDVYRCAVSISGITNLGKQFFSDIYEGWVSDSHALRMDLRYVGAKSLSDPVIAERSPAKHAGSVRAPILLLHGDRDSVIPIEQSEIMANALKKAGKPYEFVTLKSEDHWLSKADTRLQALRAVVKFLETNNPP